MVKVIEKMKVFLWSDAAADSINQRDFSREVEKGVNKQLSFSSVAPVFASNPKIDSTAAWHTNKISNLTRLIMNMKN